MKKGILMGLIIGVVVMFLVFKFGFGKEIVNITKNEIVDEESVVTRVVEKATPSVVTISMVKVGGSGNQDVGSGFIISNDGLIVTNKHVVADTTLKYKVVIGKDEVVEVENIYRDPLNDLAILRVKKTGLNAVDLGDSDKLKVGQSVIAIGTALGEFRSTVTTGVVSGLGRGIVAGSAENTEKLDNVIQTDAAINLGNSGGPLFNSGGQVIGVNVAVSASGQNIGFALPINLTKESVEYFRTTGEFDRPYLGVGYKMVNQELATKNKIVAGAWVQGISENSPAKKAGIKIGDIITEIDGEKLTDSDNGDLVKTINNKKIGDVIKVKIYRDKTEQIINVTLEKKES
ncbi:MAG: trypsin-like peptidase domain-containing protein [Candidatus Shapirobacteria bacterium]|nr:trypsin-like peptidase domain-containing protein [Candidatus Shapirobacteria bacterium]MDD3002269.1 trypsin-like peptidase domain-containing protein [Candidatus Shapirobacteria bacterium]MDD4382726.1 trypsin-like peptidase domain-containing protein [Candidatus Shapirobacteria bacterium]